MNTAKSSRPLAAYVPDFPLPKTREEFEALTYLQRVALLQSDPGIYRLFARPEPRKPWESANK